MYAVIKTGGKQYRVAADQTIEIERLKGEAGDAVEFGEVLLVANGDTLDFGAPLVAGATVAAEIVSHTRGPKLVIFKKRRRKHYRRKNGHRQDLTEVRITEILTNGARPSKQASAPKPVEAKAEAAPAESAAAETAEAKPKKPRAPRKAKPAADAGEE